MKTNTITTPEDDTFRKLKQTPFNEMRDIILHGFLLREELLVQHGWTLEEYNHARTKYFDERINLANDYYRS